MFKKSINNDNPIHNQNQKPALKNSITKIANDVNPIIITDDITKPLILSSVNVFILVLLNYKH